MTPGYIIKLGLIIKITNINAPKIEGLSLKIYKMTIARFSVTNNARQIRFFKNNFLLANTSIKVVLEMPLFCLVT